MNRFPFESRKILMVVCVVLVMGAAATAFAQGEPYLELMRTNLQTEKVAIMTEAMQLTEEQGAVFWPLYREYQTKASEIGDRRIAMMKDFAGNYGAFDAEKASQMTTEWFKIQKDRLALLEKTAKKVSKEIDPIVAVRFVQVENALNLAIDLQVASEMPLLH